MRTYRTLFIITTMIAIGIVGCSQKPADGTAVAAVLDSATVSVLDSTAVAVADSAVVVAATDSLAATPDDADRYSKLTDADFSKVADELGVEVAALRAVVEIEAGREQTGFVAPGKPVINFDRSVFRRNLSKAGIATGNYKGNAALGGGNARKTGYANAQWARLEAGRLIDRDIANKSTFWGMFQIGGFNWHKCGCKSVEEFVEKMCYSEESQLELMAEFMKNTGLVKHLKNHNWRQFALIYNGPSGLRRGYHTRLARAYAKYKR